MKNKFFMVYTIILGVLFLFSSCEKTETVDLSNIEGLAILSKSEIAAVSCGESKVVTLTAGQHIDVGTVTVSNDSENLYVMYETSGDWYLIEAHLFVGKENYIPLTGSGNPKIGRFPYHSPQDFEAGKSYTFTIPLTDLDDCFVVVAHAVVNEITNGQTMSSETAFGCGNKSFPGNRWGCYFEYCKQDCGDGCMNVFAKKLDNEFVECVNTYVNGNMYWAWSSYMLHNWLLYVAQNNSAYELPMYIKEVDDCNVPQTSHVGHVEFSLANNLQDIKIKYVFDILDMNKYSISEISLYVGPEVNPYNGDGTYKDGISTNNFYSGEYVDDSTIIIPWSLDDPYAKVNIIAYAKICKVEEYL